MGSYIEIQEHQRALVAAARAESCLNTHEALGYPSGARTEIGPGIENYYRWKHTSGPGPGRFYPMHLTQRTTW